MPVSDADMVRAWTHVLTLSKLQPKQTVTILTSENTHPQTLATARIAAGVMGAIVNRLDLPPVNGELAHSRDSLAYLGTTPLTGNHAAIAALKKSDLVLDLMTLLFSPEQADILEGGGKILLAVEPPEVLVRMLPSLEDKAMVGEVAKLLRSAKEMRVTSKAGTDLRLPIGEFPVVQEYGFVDEPGRWDHWPSGFGFTFPNEGQASGRVVLDRGDILLPMKSYISSAIEMKVENGYVTSIQGEVDADLLNDYMATFDDKEAYAISHIGWGTQKRARWSTLGLYDREQTIGMDARAYEGNFLFSMGPNIEAGGSRVTACHIDIPMRNCTVSLDNREVVHEGRLVQREGKA
jgi:2,5-dihydroxypyridine 5,6-dioxygenase